MPSKAERRNTGIAADLMDNLRAPAPSTEPKQSSDTQPGHVTPATKGKRSDPDYSLRGLLLRQDTYLDATDLLRRRKGFPDVSSLVQSLLADWVTKQQNG